MRRFVALLLCLSSVGWASQKDKRFDRICRLISTNLYEQHSQLDYLARRAQLETGSPIERAHRMRQDLGAISAAVSEKPAKRGGEFQVQFNENTYTELVAVNEFELNTVRYQSERGLIPDGSRVVVPWGHGWTGIRSHSGSVIQQVNFMNSGSNGGTYGEINKGGNRIPVASMAVDYPFHGPGPRHGEFMFYDKLLDWRYRYFAGLNRSSGGLPLVPATRSAENVPVAQLNLMYPGLFKGMIWMSPVHPHVGTVEGLEGYHHFNVSTNNQLYPEAFQLFREFTKEMRARPDSWANIEHPFGNPPTPTLIFTGSLDVETSGPTREKLREYARRYPDKVFLVEIEGAGHNVFEVKTAEDKVRNVQAWSYVYWFLNRHILENRDAQLPPYGLIYRP